MGVGKITNIIIREMKEKIFLRGKWGKKLTFSQKKKHKLWKNQKYMGAHGLKRDIDLN